MSLNYFDGTNLQNIAGSSESADVNLDYMPSEYSETKAYSKGDKIIKDKKIYTCLENITAGAYDSTKWQETSLLNDKGNLEASMVTVHQPTINSIGLNITTAPVDWDETGGSYDEVYLSPRELRFTNTGDNPDTTVYGKSQVSFSDERHSDDTNITTTMTSEGIVASDTRSGNTSELRPDYIKEAGQRLDEKYTQQADWAVTNINSPNFIKNKPLIFQNMTYTQYMAVNGTQYTGDIASGWVYTGLITGSNGSISSFDDLNSVINNGIFIPSWNKNAGGDGSRQFETVSNRNRMEVHGSTIALINKRYYKSDDPIMGEIILLLGRSMITNVTDTIVPFGNTLYHHSISIRIASVDQYKNNGGTGYLTSDKTDYYIGKHLYFYN